MASSTCVSVRSASPGNSCASVKVHPSCSLSSSSCSSNASLGQHLASISPVNAHVAQLSLQQQNVGYVSHHTGRFHIPNIGKLIPAGNLTRALTAPAATAAAAVNSAAAAPAPMPAVAMSASSQISMSGSPMDHQLQQVQQSQSSSFSLVGAECEVNLTFRAGDGQIYEATVVARRVTPELGEADAAAAAAGAAGVAAAAAVAATAAAASPSPSFTSSTSRVSADLNFQSPVPLHLLSPEPYLQPQLQLHPSQHNQQLLVHQQQHQHSPTGGGSRSPPRLKQLEIVVPMTKQRFKELTSKWEASIDECVGDDESCQSCDMNQAADDVQVLAGSSKDLNEFNLAAATPGIA